MCVCACVCVCVCVSVSVCVRVYVCVCGGGGGGQGCCAFTAKLQIATAFKGIPFELAVVPEKEAPEWFAPLGGSIPTLAQRDAAGAYSLACEGGGDSSRVLGWLDAAFPSTPTLVPEAIAGDVREWAACACAELAHAPRTVY